MRHASSMGNNTCCLLPSLSRFQKRHWQLVFQWGPQALYTKLPSSPHPKSLTWAPLCEAEESQETVGSSLLPWLITSEIVPPTLLQSRKHRMQQDISHLSLATPSAIPEYSPTSSRLAQPDITQDPKTAIPVKPHLEPTSIKDFEPVNHMDNTAEFSEAVYGDNNLISLTHLQIRLLWESLNRFLTCLSMLTLEFPLHHLHHLPLLTDPYRPEYSDDYH